MNSARWFCAVLALGILGATGCSDEEEVLQPLPVGTLNGRVTDASGDPVSGAFINLSYTILIGDQVVSTPLATAMSCLPGSATIEIFDHQNRLVIVLTEEDNCAWSGKDSEGNPVPDGPYMYRLTANDQSFERWLIVVSGSLPSRAVTALVKTDDKGFYSFPLADLPIWKTYPGPIEGELTGDHSFGSEVGIHAFRGDGTTNHGTHHVEIATPGVPVRVNLAIP